MADCLLRVVVPTRFRTARMAITLFTMKETKFYSNVKKDSQITMPKIKFKPNANAPMVIVPGRNKFQRGNVSMATTNRYILMF